LNLDSIIIYEGNLYISALSIASIRKNLAIVDFLIKSGAKKLQDALFDITNLPAYDDLVLPIVQRILESIDIEYSLKSSLENSVSRDSIEIVSVIIDKMKERGESLIKENTDDAEILIKAIDHGNFEIVELLLEKFAFAKNIICNRGKTALALAVEKNDFEIVELLLIEGFSTEKPDEIDENYALNIAAKNGNIKLLKILIDFGAEIEKETLGGAAQNGHIEAVRFILDNLDNRLLLWDRSFLEPALIDGQHEAVTMIEEEIDGRPRWSESRKNWIEAVIQSALHPHPLLVPDILPHAAEEGAASPTPVQESNKKSRLTI
jgi:ankyrin repeat protein